LREKAERRSRPTSITHATPFPFIRASPTAPDGSDLSSQIARTGLRSTVGPVIGLAQLRFRSGEIPDAAAKFARPPKTVATTGRRPPFQKKRDGKRILISKRD
jgi:hypothetical protein